MGRLRDIRLAGAALVVIACVSFVLLQRSSGDGGAVRVTDLEREWLTAHGEVRIAPDPNFPPLEFFSSDSVYSGLIADYFAIIEQNLDVRFRYVRYRTWDDVLLAAQRGEIDAITAAQVTPERQRYLTYTAPLIDIPNVIITRTEHVGTIELDDMGGMTVAVTRGNALHEYISQHFPRITVHPVATDLAALQAVSFRNADATVVNLAVASFLIENNGFTNLHVVGDSRRTNSLCVAVRRDLPVLQRILDKGVSSLTKDEHHAVFAKWVGIRTEGRFLPTDLYRIILVGSLLLLAGLLGLFLWNRTLRHRVAARTHELERELAERRRTEIALRESEQLFRSVMANMPDPQLIVDWDGGILFANMAALAIAGFEKMPEGTTHNLREFLDADSAIAAIADLEKIKNGAEGFFSEYRIEIPGKPERWVEAVGSSIVFQGRAADLVTLRDITARRTAEESIRKSLQEKEVLLREIHHRVKNNLQVISSLLSLQASRVADTTLKSLYIDSQMRIRSMAMVHERLYRSENFTSVNFGEYLRGMLDDLGRVYASPNVTWEIVAGQVHLGINQAVPCGLLTSELISNAFKHAFPGGRAGHLRVTLEKPEASAFRIVIEDDGVGYHEARADSRSVESSLGMTLVHALAEQLSATVRQESDNGTRFVIAFEITGPGGG